MPASRRTRYHIESSPSGGRDRGEVLRVLFTAQDAETIRHAFRRARPNGEHARLYEAAVAHRQADQIYNLSLTRTATVTLGRGSRGVIGIGRVKTPTLAIACRRELEIREFVPVGYFEVVATALAEGGEFKIRHAPKERIVERAKAEAAVAAAREAAGSRKPAPTCVPGTATPRAISTPCRERSPGWKVRSGRSIGRALDDARRLEAIRDDAVRLLDERRTLEERARLAHLSGFPTAGGRLRRQWIVQPVGAADVTVKYGMFGSGKTPFNTRAMTPWRNEVGETSGGKVEVKQFLNTLGGPRELYKNTKDGIADIAWVTASAQRGFKFPRSEILSLPNVLDE